MDRNFEEVNQNLLDNKNTTASVSNDTTLINDNPVTYKVPKQSTSKRKAPFKSTVTELVDLKKTAIRNHKMNYYRRRKVPTL